MSLARYRKALEAEYLPVTREICYYLCTSVFDLDWNGYGNVRPGGDYDVRWQQDRVPGCLSPVRVD